MSKTPQSITPTQNHGLGYGEKQNPEFEYKCVKCGAQITQLDNCGTGTSWSLYKCSNCGHNHAVGSAPEAAKDDNTTVFNTVRIGYGVLLLNTAGRNSLGHTSEISNYSEASVKLAKIELGKKYLPDEPLKTNEGFDLKDTFVDNMPKVHSRPSGITISTVNNLLGMQSLPLQVTRRPKLSVDSFALQGVLADYEIKDLINSGLMVIAPFTDQKVSSSDGIKRISYGLSSMGYDATLHEDVYFISKDLSAKPIDPKNTSLDQYSKAKVHTDETGSYVLVPPHTFVLGRTVEYFKIPNFIIATVTSKSTYARCGIPTIATPIEPGFYGTITLEFINSTEHYNKLYINEGVVQLLFHVSNKPDKDYTESGGKYNGQTDVRAAEV